MLKFVLLLFCGVDRGSKSISSNSNVLIVKYIFNAHRNPLKYSLYSTYCDFECSNNVPTGFKRSVITPPCLFGVLESNWLSQCENMKKTVILKFNEAVSLLTITQLIIVGCTDRIINEEPSFDKFIDVGYNELTSITL